MKLTIAIPTYNRAHALNDVLRILAPQVEVYKDEVVIHVHDNASQDATRFTALGHPFVKYFRNESNLGPFENQRLAVERAQTEYVWIICDDDLPTPHALTSIMYALGSDLIVSDLLLDGEGVIDKFQDYYGEPEEFFKDALKYSPRYLLCVGGFSNVVFRKSCYDMFEWKRARDFNSTYPHHFALWGARTIQTIAVIKHALVTGREAILPAPDRLVSILPSDSHWRDCVAILNAKYNINAPLDIISKVISQDQIGMLFQHPIKAFIKFSPLLLIPRNWYKILWRFYHYFKR